jgi:PKHD-type hydroxylase
MVQANTDAGWEYDIDYVQDMQLTRYENGMFYGWHSDGSGDHKSKYSEEHQERLRGRVRKLSLTLLLNEGYEGGHFEFTGYSEEKSEVHRPDFNKAGSIIVFPSHLEHRVTEVTKGIRNSLVAWFIGPPFR